MGTLKKAIEGERVMVISDDDNAYITGVIVNAKNVNVTGKVYVKLDKHPTIKDCTIHVHVDRLDRYRTPLQLWWYLNVSSKFRIFS